MSDWAVLFMRWRSAVGAPRSPFYTDITRGFLADIAEAFLTIQLILLRYPSH